jgi:hypothetical protein
MKDVTPRADYPVRVRRRQWEEASPVADLYDGIFDVNLNSSVDVVFVPDMSAFAPPFDGADLPRDLDAISSPAQAQLVAVLTGTYVVTPNTTRSGTEEPLTGLFDDPGVAGTAVFFVTPAEFTRYATELDELSNRLAAFYPSGTVDDLREYEVIAFLERVVFGSEAFRPEDAAILGLAKDEPD